MFIEVSSETDIETVESLAREIWTGHYLPIIGKAQTDYMLDKFQSRRAISEQIKSGFLYFLIEEGGKAIGYMAVQPKGDALVLGKIYVHSSRRRKGYGRKAVRFAEDLAKEKGLVKLSLTVNKHNTGAIRAYERIGFKNLGSVIQEIGSGFIMDDYLMEKPVRSRCYTEKPPS